MLLLGGALADALCRGRADLWWGIFHGFPKRVGKLKNTPTWAFHGANDDVVPLAESQNLVEALRESGGIVKLTVYPHAGHDSWTETYNNPELYSWLLSQ